MSPSPIQAESSIHGLRLSTVVPASITGEEKAHHQFSAMDLAMKLHYITTVHFFDADAAYGLTVQDLKAPMFRWLQLYYPICGRIRRDDGGRPFVKCNDSGVRIVEAECEKTVDEWLAVVDGGDRHRLLVYHQPIVAHDFGFTPLVFLQVTRFKCGGLSMGMRWAHVLGDVFLASECINTWAKVMAHQKVPSLLNTTPPATAQQFSTLAVSSSCLSVKPLDSPLGDNWLIPNNSKMQKMHTFHITEEQLSNNLLSEENKNVYKVNPFEVISAIVWKSLAKKTSGNHGIVTVCRKSVNFDHETFENKLLVGNRYQVIGIVEAPKMGLMRDADFLDIAKLIGDKFVDETNMIGKRAEGDEDVDFLVYGSNLTFVDMEEVNLWGLEINGRGPVFADASIGGVGDGGCVLVVPHGGGRTVNVILAEDELQHLKNELEVEYGII